MNKYFLIITFISILLVNRSIHAQNDLDRILKGGEIIVNGLTLLKKNKPQVKKENTKIIESICVQNKMEQKITFSIIGKDAKGSEIQKELVIQKDGKECVFELPIGIYTYKIVLSNNEIFKKGEYKFEEELTIIVRQENE